MRTEPAPIHRQIDLDHPVDDVWQLLATSEGLARWLGEGSAVDARPGGALDVDDVETGVRRFGVVDLVEPGARIAWRWWPEDGADASTVELELTPTPTGTRVTVTESLVAPTSDADAATVPDAVASTASTASTASVAVGPSAAAWTWRGVALALAAATVLAVAG
jgi:uncharacterized protein YndB with AHSA1/START domain